MRDRRGLARIVVVVAFVVGAGCSSSRPPPSETNRVVTDAGNNGDTGPLTFNGRCTMPSVVRLTVTGFTKCSCLNGTFALTKVPADFIWSSSAITGCPGQSEGAYLRYSNDPQSPALGVTSADSPPGRGNSNLSPAASVTCTPLKITGSGSVAGNIGSFCDAPEDDDLRWTIEE